MSDDKRIDDFLAGRPHVPGQDGDGPEPRAVAVGHGMTWLLDGFALFRQSPGMWILAFILFIVFTSLLSVVPFLGSLASMLISPILMGGFMVACKRLENDGELTFEDLLAGFRTHPGRLAGIGALYLLGMILVMVIGVMLFALFTGLDNLDRLTEQLATADPAVAGLGFLLPLLVILLLIMPLLMAYWFAPALVILHGMGPLDAMVRSFFGCLRNVLPFTVYGFVLLGLFILGALPMLLGLLIVGPMAIASVYTGYRDIFL